MKRNINSSALIALLIMCIGALTSCIRDEAPNAEADILSCDVEGIEMVQSPVVTNQEVRFYVNAWDDLTHLAPTFTITEGATIEPASGTERDFTTPQTYTVTSEDGNWSKTYTVSFLSSDIASKYSFENVKYYKYNGKDYFHIFYELNENNDTIPMASGNAGYMITLMFSKPNATAADYPTSQSDDGYVNKCVKLETRSTGALGARFGSPIAAGNLFLGEFDPSSALTDALTTTHFGTVYKYTPKALTGYYKYQPGEQITDKQNNKVDGTDIFDIYGVMFEASDTLEYLNGHNVQTADAIVLKAKLNDEDKISDNQWHKFTIEFEPVSTDKTIDLEKLKAGKYKLTIVMTSSIKGASFTGAVGSTLYVDEVELYYE